ncbi:hypothetical protein PO183_18690 [Bacteroides ovatus]|uniref:hypothetical protein n=1 Tax=Bacteroides TaxID=816 RepID=UPI002308074B|nr:MULTISPECIES: hypothetical protein [Bacteroides]MDB0699293.1 hypothetical protein [Bacteroides xylanisolvens]MDB0708828.1 hypothetical protein [Bacteroides xylanisolvens]MDC2368149.1 hypothetical protein [Bacteroides ovatus]
MRKSLNQIINEANVRLPKQSQVIEDYCSIKISDGIGGVVTVTYVKHYGGWALCYTDYY